MYSGNVLRGAVLSSVVMLSACEPGSAVQSPGPVMHESAAPLPSMSHSPADMRQTVDISRLPEALPPAVAAQEPNVAAVQVTLQQGREELPGGLISDSLHEYRGSALRISDDLYLSAGHIVMNSDNSFVEGTETCGTVRVETVSERPTGLRSDMDGMTTQLYGASLRAERMAGSYDELHADTVPDVLLLHAPDTYDVVPPEKAVDLENEMPVTGDPLFFMNYQPTPQGAARTPAELEISSWEDVSALTNPAVFGGIVLRSMPNGNLLVADGIRSYGVIHDPFGRSGQSGGPVFTEDGEVVGMSIRGLAEPVAAKVLADHTNVRLKGILPDQLLSLTVVQPFDQQEIMALTEDLAEAPVCTPTAAQ